MSILELLLGILFVVVIAMLIGGFIIAKVIKRWWNARQQSGRRNSGGYAADRSAGGPVQSVDGDRLTDDIATDDPLMHSEGDDPTETIADQLEQDADLSSQFESGAIGLEGLENHDYSSEFTDGNDDLH